MTNRNDIKVKWKTANGYAEGVVVGETTYYNISLGGGKTMLVDKNRCEICDISESIPEQTVG